MKDSKLMAKVSIVVCENLSLQETVQINQHVSSLVRRYFPNVEIDRGNQVSVEYANWTAVGHKDSETYYYAFQDKFYQGTLGGKTLADLMQDFSQYFELNYRVHYENYEPRLKKLFGLGYKCYYSIWNKALVDSENEWLVLSRDNEFIAYSRTSRKMAWLEAADVITRSGKL